MENAFYPVSLGISLHNKGYDSQAWNFKFTMFVKRKFDDDLVFFMAFSLRSMQIHECQIAFHFYIRLLF